MPEATRASTHMRRAGAAAAVRSVLLIAVFPALPGVFAAGQAVGPLDIARSAAAAGNVTAAIDAYAQAVDAAERDPERLREAATYAFRERRWYEAARWLDRYVILAPGDPAGWFDLGAVRHNQCRFDLAIQVLRQMVALEASVPGLEARAEHRFLLGESARRLERFGEAIPELEVAVARAPDRDDYRRALAQALFDGGRFEAAASEFARLVRTSGDADAYFGLGSALAESGKAEDAVAALKESRRLRPRDARVLLRLGNLALRAKDLRRAESYLVEAREVAPRNVDVLFALAQALRLSGEVQDAEAVRAVATEIRKDVDAATERGRIYSRGLVSNPEDAAAHRTYALDLLAQSRFDDAQMIFSRLLSFAPRDEIAILNLSSLLARQGDAGAAFKEVRKILDVAPDHEVANVQAARLRILGQDPRAAIAFAERALATNPKSAPAHEVLVGVYRALGDAAAAARHEAALAALAGVESGPVR